MQMLRLSHPWILRRTRQVIDWTETRYPVLVDTPSRPHYWSLVTVWWLLQSVTLPVLPVTAGIDSSKHTNWNKGRMEAETTGLLVHDSMPQ